MSKRVRVSAFLLMLMMVMNTVGMVQVAYGVGTDIKWTNRPNSFKAGDTIASMAFEVTDVGNGGCGWTPEMLEGGTAIMDTSSDFENGTFEIAPISAGVQTDTAKYKVTVKNAKLKAGSTTANLTIKVTGTKVVNGKTYGTQTITTPVPNFDDGSGGSGSGGTASNSNARYTVTKVSAVKRVGNVDSPATPPRFDINNVASGSDATIRQTYFVDIKLRVSDEKAPAGLDVKNIVGYSGADKMELGSFSLDKNQGGSMAITDSTAGYFEVTITNMRYSGNDKKLSFQVSDGSTYLTDVLIDPLSECYSKKEADAAYESNKNNNNSDSSMEVETPYVIVSKYSYGGGSVTAGDTFPLSLTFYNTSEFEDVSNMMITISMPDDLMLTSSSNTFYVPTLDTHESITKSVQVTAKPAAKAQSHNVQVSMKYQYVDSGATARRSAETTENIAIPVVQVDRFQLTSVDISPEVMLEEETSVTVNYVNKGRSDVYNVSVSIDGDIANPGQNQNMGNLASGATGSADFFITPNATGLLTGEITVSYEDTNMEEKTATIRYNCNVISMEEMMGGAGGIDIGGMVPSDGDVIPVDEKGKANWPVILIVSAVVLIPAGIVIKKRIDKKRREQEDADL